MPPAPDTRPGTVRLWRLAALALPLAALAGQAAERPLWSPAPPEPFPVLPPSAPAPAPAQAAPAMPALPPLDLATARKLALEHQPSVAAARASLAAAVARQQALERVHLGGVLLARDLPVRRQQAAAGVEGTQAAVCQAEADAAAAATVTYLAVLYALEQQKVLADARSRLEDLRGKVQKIIDLKDKGRADVTTTELKRLDSYLAFVEARRAEAATGQERGLAALREALGLPPCTPLTLAQSRLPEPGPGPEGGREQVIALALARRGEVAQSQAAERAAALEIEAQHALLLPNARTFASGSDLHAQMVPPTVFYPNYLPGGIVPEMPPMLPGGRAGRVEQAEAYHARTEAVVAKARNLIALQAEDAYLRWQEKAAARDQLRKALTAAQAFADELRETFSLEKASPPTLTDLLNANVTATRLQVDVNEAQYELLLNLSALERVTVGGFCPQFGPPQPQAAPAR
jgi:outer membrane protein TolC